MPGPQPVLSPIDTFLSLHSQLKRAILASKDPAAMEKMRQADAAVIDAITALNQVGFHERTAEFEAVSASLNSHLAELTKLKDSLDSIVADVELAAKVVAAIDSAVSAAAQVFPLASTHGPTELASESKRFSSDLKPAETLVSDFLAQQGLILDEESRRIMCLGACRR